MIARTSAVAALCSATAVSAQLPLSVDTSFKTEISTRYVADIHFLDDGRILVTGDMRFPGEWAHHGKGFLNTDGTTEGFQGGPGSGMVSQLHDKYFIAGGQYFNKYNSDFTLDQSYHHLSPFISPTNGGEFHVLPDGKVLTTGSHVLRSYEDTTSLGDGYCLVRLDTNGYPDSTFTHRRCLFGFVSRIEPLADGKYLLAGRQDYYNSQAVGGILRVWPDGSIDTTFRTNVIGLASGFYFYPDGRILAGGYFTSVPDYPGDTLHVIRIMPNGDIDTTFDNTIDFRRPGAYFASGYPVRSIFELKPDVLVITGAFTHVDGMEVGGIIAMDTAGNLLNDMYFTGFGCDTVEVANDEYDRYIDGMERSPDGSYFIYGSFGGFDDGHALHPDQAFVVKLQGLEVGVWEGKGPSDGISIYPNPGMDQLTVELQSYMTTSKVELMDISGRALMREEIKGPRATFCTSALSVGTYCLRVFTSEGTTTLKWIKR